MGKKLFPTTLLITRLCLYTYSQADVCVPPWPPFVPYFCSVPRLLPAVSSWVRPWEVGKKALNLLAPLDWMGEGRHNLNACGWKVASSGKVVRKVTGLPVTHQNGVAANKTLLAFPAGVTLRSEGRHLCSAGNIRILGFQVCNCHSAVLVINEEKLQEEKWLLFHGSTGALTQLGSLGAT